MSTPHEDIKTALLLQKNWQNQLNTLAAKEKFSVTGVILACGLWYAGVVRSYSPHSEAQTREFAHAMLDDALDQAYRPEFQYVALTEGQDAKK